MAQVAVALMPVSESPVADALPITASMLSNVPPIDVSSPAKPSLPPACDSVTAREVV